MKSDVQYVTNGLIREFNLIRQRPFSLLHLWELQFAAIGVEEVLHAISVICDFMSKGMEWVLEHILKEKRRSRAK